MQTHDSAPPRRQRRRPQISCTECRRRKQKCNPRKDGPCANCLRRYPPVPCYVQDLDDPNIGCGAPQKVTLQSETTLRFVDHGPGPRDSISSPLHESHPANYPAIPLSRILHPIEDPSPYHEAVHAMKQEIKQYIVDDVEKVHPDSVENGPPSENKLELVQKRLKYMDPGMQEAMHNRLESPSMVGGVLSMLNTFNTMPVKTTLRNTELFYFFHNFVAPTFCSVDGGSIPPLFAAEILPWMMKSPLMPNVAILMASAAQNHAGMVKNSETLIIKSHVLSLVNRFIQEDFFLVGNQALRIVIHLVVLEMFWGNAENIWPHMEGIKQMLKIRGGLVGMNDPLNAHVLIVTDYELACAFERELDLQSMETAISTELPIRENYPAKARCPVLPYPSTFQECRETLSLSITAAEILDDVRFLTTSITSCFLSPELEPTKTSKIQSTAAWLHKRIEAIPALEIVSITPTSDIIIDTIRLSALVYTSAIQTLTPLSQNFPPDLQERMHSNISLVGLRNWKEIPGIFLWILLVATPCAKDDYRGRFLRKQMACTGMAIGLEDFLLGTACLRAFWLVQRWIAREGGEGCLDVEGEAEAENNVALLA
ncbi:hypothetical protein ONS95_004742 [Cadophora gregata]|uniref:uncharacterized protein n=1 Tax=Cadophora gregata TaxID=51156 RepID=UPI0026DC3970|nr:uncharacterized protein ONS95_004742 [Cadophora gregata]KAK0104453.1 hypothetical protein ONS95_004742 [Cadophora gregata]KAK0115454.1 hypothetical protein ONS96_013910 [Cadophora gregata f. sp. sojae]